jgi:DNA-binding NarL/FixJ family response regulator
MRPHDYGCRDLRATAKLGLARRGGHAAGTTIMTEQGETGEAITILLVEDDAPTCWRLQDALVKAGYEVRTAGSLSEARSALASGAPRVLLTDLRLPDGHGVELIRETRRRFPGTEIMVISALGDEESVISAITVGATGYLLKDAFPTDIATTVRDLVAGHSPISASIARFIVRRTQGTAQGAAEPPPGPALNTARLTPREIDILWGIAKGFSYAEIASHLGLSRQTVPGHIKNIYRKLEVHTRGEAVFEAVQQGLIKL